METFRIQIIWISLEEGYKYGKTLHGKIFLVET